MARAAGGRVLTPGVSDQGLNPFVIDRGDSEELLQRIGSLRDLLSDDGGDLLACEALVAVFDLPDELQRWLLSCPRGDGLLLARGNRFPIRIEATPEETEVIEWRPGPRHYEGRNSP